MIRKLIKKWLAPMIQEALKEEKSKITQEMIDQRVYEVLAKCFHEGSKI